MSVAPPSSRHGLAVAAASVVVLALGSACQKSDESPSGAPSASTVPSSTSSGNAAPSLALPRALVGALTRKIAVQSKTAAPSAGSGSSTSSAVPSARPAPSASARAPRDAGPMVIVETHRSPRPGSFPGDVARLLKLESVRRAFSGVVVGKNLVVTAHEAALASAVRVRVPGGAVHEQVTLVQARDDLGLAVLEVPGELPEPALVAPDGAAKAGTEMTVLGTILGLDPERTDGTVKSVTTRSKATVLGVTTSAPAGLPGGPALDQAGRLIGVMTLVRGANNNEAIAARHVRELLTGKASKIPFKPFPKVATLANFSLEGGPMHPVEAMNLRILGDTLPPLLESCVETPPKAGRLILTRTSTRRNMALQELLRGTMSMSSTLGKAEKACLGPGLKLMGLRAFSYLAEKRAQRPGPPARVALRVGVEGLKGTGTMTVSFVIDLPDQP